jgi:hypothetical protein
MDFMLLLIAVMDEKVKLREMGVACFGRLPVIVMVMKRRTKRGIRRVRKAASVTPTTTTHHTISMLGSLS